MKTKYIIALASLLTFASCQSIIDFPEESDSGDGKVTVDFSVRVPDAGPDTKALGEVPAFETNGLYVIVYEGGYRREVVRANIDGAPTVTGGNFVYKYSLTLSTSENPRNLHFVSMAGFTAADAPFEESRIGAEMYSSDGVDAYWQRVKLAKISDVPATLKSDIGTVTMIRNFAKITMSKDATAVPDTKFRFVSYKVFNTPTRGHIAPYIVSGTNAGYVDNYHNLTYAQAYDKYPGKVPVGATYNGYTSADEDCLAANGWIAWTSSTAESAAAYFYERPIPTDASAAFIVVKGYYEGSSTPCFYKINLKDKDDKYYALLRGFRFKINIEKVTGSGLSTVKAAIESAGSGNISTTLDYIDVTNISDGNCRLFVSSTSVTVVKQTTITIKYKFCPTASNTSTVANGVIDVDDSGTTNGIEVTVNDPEDEGEPSISKTSGNWNVAVHDLTSDKDSDGYNYITITTTAPEKLYKEQIVTIRGRGTNSSNTTIIQRDIHIIVRPVLILGAKQTGTLPTTTAVGNNVTVTFGLQPDLPSSIFPLNVKIEAPVLTPNNAPTYPTGTPTVLRENNLPVESGASDVSPYKPSYHFVKTVTYDMYTAASALTKQTFTVNSESMDLVPFDCYFKTNTATSRGTQVNVSCDLFDPVSFTLQ